MKAKIILFFMTATVSLLVGVASSFATWHNVTEQRRADIAGNQGDYALLTPENIRQVLYFDAEGKGSGEKEINFLAKPHVVLFVLHGTFAKGSDEFWLEENELFTQVKNFAASLGGDVEVVSFEWSGENSDKARLRGGAQIAELIDHLYADEKVYTTLLALAHSHGG